MLTEPLSRRSVSTKVFVLFSPVVNPPYPKLMIFMCFFVCFVFLIKDFFIQDINAGLKDETEIPEQLVST